MSRSIFIAAALALAVTLPAVQAQAQVPRTFVSAAGNDSNPCSFALPCRHFQAAVDATSAGGEVDALDPAGYSPITISRAITIEGQGWSYIAPPPSGAAITINAVSGNVTIHGVSLNGAGVTGGTNGIVFNSGLNLTVTDSVVQNFTGTGPNAGNGIFIQPTAGAISFAIINTKVSNSSSAGIFYGPQSGTATADGIIDHVIAQGNSNGIEINNSIGGGSATVAISNSVASNNSNDGISILNNGTTALAVTIDNSSFAANGSFGISATGTSNVTLGRSMITANVVQGIHNATVPITFYTYGNNGINGNTEDFDHALDKVTRTLR